MTSRAHAPWLCVSRGSASTAHAPSPCSAQADVAAWRGSWLLPLPGRPSRRDACAPLLLHDAQHRPSAALGARRFSSTLVFPEKRPPAFGLAARWGAERKKPPPSCDDQRGLVSVRGADQGEAQRERASPQENHGTAKTMIWEGVVLSCESGPGLYQGGIAAMRGKWR